MLKFQNLRNIHVFHDVRNKVSDNLVYPPPPPPGDLLLRPRLVRFEGHVIREPRSATKI